MDRTDDEMNSNFFYYFVELVRLGISLEDITAGTEPVPTEELRKLKASPSSLDYRAQGKVSSIKSQGSCGCCWSFTTVGMYESWMMFKGEAEYDLSEQYLLECTTKFTRNIKNRNLVSDCGGGYLDQAIGLAKLNGLPLESAYPYLAKNYQSSSGYPTTPGICSTKSTYVYGQDPSKISAYTSQNNTH
jgi:C1A family cysteine protease